MKLINFSFICAMIFMIGPSLIHTESNPELNLGKPFPDKPRKLQQSNYIVIEYGSDITFSKSGTDGITFKKDGVEISQGTKVPPETKIEIHFQPIFSNKGTLQSFFNSYVPNAGKITLIDFTKFDSSKLKIIQYLFYGCTSLKIANLSNLKLGDDITSGNVFSDCKNF